ncbi:MULTISPECIES: hypothetical protein [unclassified Caballeronia]|nr:MULTISPECIES: hypothetical protein [unclassified Caballeronia]MDR5822266.1 hypothetical protein [Caballeronia sp. LZ043]MDR5883436.1 hypothetical protein [Caballeronia sp. LZ032]
MTTERNALLAVALTSTALLAACGSNEDNSPPATPAVDDGKNSRR